VTEAIIQQQQEQIRQEHETAVARRHKEIVRQVDAEVAKAAQAAAQAEQAVVANRQRAIKQQQLDAEKAKQAADAKQRKYSTHVIWLRTERRPKKRLDGSGSILLFLRSPTSLITIATCPVLRWFLRGVICVMTR
jgi:spermidine synthase